MARGGAAAGAGGTRVPSGRPHPKPFPVCRWVLLPPQVSRPCSVNPQVSASPCSWPHLKQKQRGGRCLWQGCPLLPGSAPQCPQRSLGYGQWLPVLRPTLRVAPPHDRPLLPATQPISDLSGAHPGAPGSLREVAWAGGKGGFWTQLRSQPWFR